MEPHSRKCLPHQVPLWIDPQKEVYFITINCQRRDVNQLARWDIANPLLNSVRFRNERFIWFAHLFLLMPDHVHALISFPPSAPLVGTPGPGVPARAERAERTLQDTVTSWKRWTARHCSIVWQRDFFEHRLRSDESRRDKANYILANPVRKGLVKESQDWPYVFIPNPTAR